MGDSVTITASNGRITSLSGLNQCGGALCPRCSGIKSSQDRSNLDRVIPYAMSSGFNAYFVTLTQNKKINVAGSINSLRSGLSSMTTALRNARRALNAEVISYGVIENVISCHEDRVLIGNKFYNQIHSHYHQIILIRKSKTYSRKDQTSCNHDQTILDKMISGYERGLKKAGSYVSRSNGIDIQQIKHHDQENISKYLTKVSSMAYEVTLSSNKEGKSRSFHQLLKDIFTFNDTEDIKTYKQILEANIRKKIIFRSRSFGAMVKELDALEEDEMLCQLEDTESKREETKCKELTVEISKDIWKAFSWNGVSDLILDLVSDASIGKNKWLFDELNYFLSDDNGFKFRYHRGTNYYKRLKSLVSLLEEVMLS